MGKYNEKRTDKEIKDQIKTLKEERSKLPQYSMFGNNNWGNLDTKIKILEGSLKKDKYELADELDEVLEQYSGDFPPDETSDKWKVDALDWLLNHIDEL